MAENNRLPTQPRDPFDRFDEAISDPRLYEADQSRYEQLRYEPEPRYEQPRYEQPRYEQPQYEQPFALQYERTDMLPVDVEHRASIRPIRWKVGERFGHAEQGEAVSSSPRMGTFERVNEDAIRPLQ